ncbi:MAG: hypothetical protein AB7S26_01600 [Sandaracinaceae bacterium]
MLTLSGCYLSHGRDGDPPAHPPPRRRDAAADGRSTRPDRALPDAPTTTSPDAPFDSADGAMERECTSPVGVDLLLVLDDSGSTRPEDSVLLDRVTRLVQRLARPPDDDDDGVEDWARVDDMHIGIVNTSVQGTDFCAETLDGALRRGEGAAHLECLAAPYPPYQAYEDGDNIPALTHDLACVAFGPRTGCQVEQPLEAMAKALLPSDSPFTFIAGRAHGDTDNAGFLRPDSVLAVIVFTDEDDCSVRDTSIFEPPPAPDAGPRPWPPGWPPPREGAPGCEGAPWGLYDVERYVEVLDYLRPEHPERALFTFVGGIIPAFTTDLNSVNTSCFRADFPRRVVELARLLPSRAAGGSWCSLGEIAFVQGLAEMIGAAACTD